jgi:hypothetical protein
MRRREKLLEREFERNMLLVKEKHACNEIKTMGGGKRR